MRWYLHGVVVVDKVDVVDVAVADVAARRAFVAACSAAVTAVAVA